MMETVARLMDQLVEQTSIPSISIAVRQQGRLILHHTAGLARLQPPREALLDQPYDLASLTKPLAGATALAALLERGVLDLDAPVCRWLPQVDARIRVRQLLHHASGWPAWAPLHERVGREQWGTAAGRRALLDEVYRVPLAYEPGTAHVYSDLGFLVLLDLIERVGGARLDEQLAPWLQGTVGQGLRWGWPDAAATEDRPDRGGVIEGEVHDPLAFAMGGVSSHAGLFGTALSVSAFAEAVLEAWAGRGAALPVRGMAALWADRGPGSHRGGWDTPAPPSSEVVSAAGRLWPADGRGHLGYTGTSVWMAPRQRVVVALLTNRVHPGDDKSAIRAVRVRLHEAVARALGWGDQTG